jgi:hypothetical protein
LRTETDFLHDYFLRFGFDLLLFLFLFVEELLVIYDTTNGRISIGYDLHKVETGFLRNFERFTDAVNARLYAFAYNAYLRYVADLFIDPV